MQEQTLFSWSFHSMGEAGHEIDKHDHFMTGGLQENKQGIKGLV